MKRIYSLLAALLLTLTTQAQSPELITYQALLRNSEDKLLTTTEVGMRISLLKQTVDGTVVYTETHLESTNANGLLTLNIGAGTSTDDFSSIDWSQGPYFIKTETDPNGGTDYSITATSQLLSVPYALHSKTANRALTLAGEIDYTYIKALEARIKVLEDVPFIGEYRDGGIVFYIAPEPTDLDGDGDLDTGLVCATEDQSSAVKWYNVSEIETGATATSVGSGATNTAVIIAVQGEGTYAASVASAYDGGGFDDWFLPSKYEINLMYVNLKSKDLGGFLDSYYWSATEYDENYAWLQNFGSGGQYVDGNPKDDAYNVRAVRAF